MCSNGQECCAAKRDVTSNYIITPPHLAVVAGRGLSRDVATRQDWSGHGAMLRARLLILRIAHAFVLRWWWRWGCIWLRLRLRLINIE